MKTYLNFEAAYKYSIGEISVYHLSVEPSFFEKEGRLIILIRGAAKITQEINSFQIAFRNRTPSEILIVF